MNINKKLLAIITLVSLVINAVAIYQIISLKNEKEQLINSYYEQTTSFVSNIKVARSFLEIVLSQKDAPNNLKNLIYAFSSISVASNISRIHDLSVKNKLGIETHLSTLMGLEEEIINDLISKSLKNNLTNEDWIKLSNLSNDLKILSDQLDIDVIRKANKNKLIEIYNGISWEKL